MNRRAEIDMLKDIRKICDARRVRAELDIERLNSRLEGLDRRRTAEAERLTIQEKSWEKSIRGGAIQLTASAAWAAEILRTRAGIADIETDILNSQAERHPLYQAFQSISARSDAVGALIEQGIRRAARHREEAIMENYVGRKVPEGRA